MSNASTERCCPSSGPVECLTPILFHATAPTTFTTPNWPLQTLASEGLPSRCTTGQHSTCKPAVNGTTAQLSSDGLDTSETHGTTTPYTSISAVVFQRCTNPRHGSIGDPGQSRHNRLDSFRTLISPGPPARDGPGETLPLVQAKGRPVERPRTPAPCSSIARNTSTSCGRGCNPACTAGHHSGDSWQPPLRQRTKHFKKRLVLSSMPQQSVAKTWLRTQSPHAAPSFHSLGSIVSSGVLVCAMQRVAAQTCSGCLDSSSSDLTSSEQSSLQYRGNSPRGEGTRRTPYVVVPATASTEPRHDE